jgi:hypothetical protein
MTAARRNCDSPSGAAVPRPAGVQAPGDIIPQSLACTHGRRGRCAAPAPTPEVSAPGVAYVFVRSRTLCPLITAAGAAAVARADERKLVRTKTPGVYRRGRSYVVIYRAGGRQRKEFAQRSALPSSTRRGLLRESRWR